MTAPRGGLRYLVRSLAVAAVLFAVWHLSDALAQTPTPQTTAKLLALDADPTGNTATLLGELQSCRRVQTNAEAVVDLVVDAIPEDRPIVSFQVVINYDKDLLEVSEVDYEQLLASNGNFQPFEAAPQLSDPLPDRDGQLSITVLDLASNETPGANVESGPGIISRVTFKVKAAGLAALSIGYDPPNIYPILADIYATAIGIEQLGSATLAIGQDCPAELPPVQLTAIPIPTVAGMTPTPPAGQDPSPGASADPGVSTSPGTGSQTASPLDPPIVSEDSSDGDDTLGIAIAAALALAGVAALALSGVWLYRRSQGVRSD